MLLLGRHYNRGAIDGESHHVWLEAIHVKSGDRMRISVMQDSKGKIGSATLVFDDNDRKFQIIRSEILVRNRGE